MYLHLKPQSVTLVSVRGVNAREALTTLSDSDLHVCAPDLRRPPMCPAAAPLHPIGLLRCRAVSVQMKRPANDSERLKARVELSSLY